MKASRAIGMVALAVTVFFLLTVVAYAENNCSGDNVGCTQTVEMNTGNSGSSGGTGSGGSGANSGDSGDGGAGGPTGASAGGSGDGGSGGAGNVAPTGSTAGTGGSGGGNGGGGGGGGSAGGTGDHSGVTQDEDPPAGASASNWTAPSTGNPTLKAPARMGSAPASSSTATVPGGTGGGNVQGNAGGSIGGFSFDLGV